MLNNGSSISEDVIREWPPHELAFYSIYMRGDVNTASIYSTRLSPVPIQTWAELIESDDIAQACTGYLVRTGAPVFKHITPLDRYTDAVEEQCRAGLNT